MVMPLTPCLKKRGGEPGFSPFSSQEKGVGGMSSNVRLAEIGHFLALYSNFTSFPHFQYLAVAQDQPAG